MSLGVVGQKCGMTRIFFKNGDSIPVTVVYVKSNLVTQIKTIKDNGYCAVQVTTGIKKRSLVKKPEAGHYSKALVEPGRGLWEFSVKEKSLRKIKLGKVLDLSLFKIGEKVDVKATSKGKGFQGVVKRHNFRMQDATHGNSLSHRVHGSTGQNQTPGRVFKGKKMAGHMGAANVTIKSLEILLMDFTHGILVLKGSVPGPRGSNLLINTTNKVQYSISKGVL